jgi:hypothetical protein
LIDGFSFGSRALRVLPFDIDELSGPRKEPPKGTQRFNQGKTASFWGAVNKFKRVFQI